MALQQLTTPDAKCICQIELKGWNNADWGTYFTKNILGPIEKKYNCEIIAKVLPLDFNHVCLVEISDGIDEEIRQEVINAFISSGVRH